MEQHVVFNARPDPGMAVLQGSLQNLQVLFRPLHGGQARNLLFQRQTRFQNLGQLRLPEPVANRHGKTVGGHHVSAVPGPGFQHSHVDQGLQGFPDGVVAHGKGAGQLRLRRNAVSHLPLAGPYHGLHGIEDLPGKGQPHGFLQIHLFSFFHGNLSESPSRDAPCPS